ncbi:MAG: hypothetical protein J7L63_05490 [Thermoplasmata archaeon]|nr:hypothetical protein [Thermoplasmata archaeon]
MNMESVKERIKHYPGEIILDVYGIEGDSGFIVLSFTKDGKIEGELTIRTSRKELRELAKFLRENMNKIFRHQRNVAQRALEEILT